MYSHHANTIGVCIKVCQKIYFATRWHTFKAAFLINVFLIWPWNCSCARKYVLSPCKPCGSVHKKGEQFLSPLSEDTSKPFQSSSSQIWSQNHCQALFLSFIAIFVTKWKILNSQCSRVQLVLQSLITTCVCGWGVSQELKSKLFSRAWVRFAGERGAAAVRFATDRDCITYANATWCFGVCKKCDWSATKTFEKMYQKPPWKWGTYHINKKIILKA